MRITFFKRVVTVFFLCAIALSATAQQDHFIYLQTENTQPFYVKMNNKLVSSSAMGYLIIPKLIDGDYKLNIGFPKNEFPEEGFTISVDNKNQGYLLKNFGDKGWGLFNMQSYAIVMSGSSGKKETVSQNIENDPFSKMLAKVVKDSSILQKNEPPKPLAVKMDSSTVVASNAVASDTVAMNNAPVKADSSNIIAAPNNTAESNVSGKTEMPSASLTPAKKLLSKKNKDGMEMVYIDSDVNENDTVRIFIPADKGLTAAAPKIPDTVQTENPPLTGSKADASAIVEKKVPESNNKATDPAVPVFLDNITSIKAGDTTTQKSGIKRLGEIEKDSLQKNEIADSTSPDNVDNDINQDKMVVLPKVVKSSATNSDCKAFADNDYFLRIRKKMASASSEDAMIKIAQKAFHAKCFSTEQIKNLSFLFLTNAGKYRFFDEAYAFTSDSDNYFTLQSQLTDSYYVNRFKAMIHK